MNAINPQIRSMTERIEERHGFFSAVKEAKKLSNMIAGKQPGRFDDRGFFWIYNAGEVTQKEITKFGLFSLTLIKI